MIIAITGLMGVGKTTVSQMFESLGANVINADDIGHELLCRNEVKNRILSEFGSDVLTDDIIDREKLASKVIAAKS